MFFKKPRSSDEQGAPQRSAAGEGGSVPQLGVIQGGAGATSGLGDGHALHQVLDALDGVLAALARYPIELPDRTEKDSVTLLTKWRQHATLGYPVNDGVEDTSVGVQDRDWSGLVRAVRDLRKEEHLHVNASIGELRDALWACVETVHNAVKVDQRSEVKTQEQMEKARNAIKRLQTGSIKQEVMSAMMSMESAMQERREQQASQFSTLASRLDHLGQQLEEARRESTTDALTGVGNRKLFDSMVERAVHMFSMSRQPVVLLMIDMDRLKMVNDMFGHQAGDQAIATLGAALRKVFLRQTDIVCRYGGDEFAVILHNTDWKLAQTLGRRLQEAVSKMPPPHPAMEFSLGISVGVAQLEPLEEPDRWKARADHALYKAKHNGFDRVVVADRTVPPERVTPAAGVPAIRPA